jgi:hypothetical protein
VLKEISGLPAVPPSLEEPPPPPQPMIARVEKATAITKTDKQADLLGSFMIMFLSFK